jgi:3-hydroxyisobutyrate dehydrogenase-like beta-hydroxyacid dehydrogenase
MRVGFIGLGNMGGPMARNLLRAGFPLVVFNRTRAKGEDLARAGAVLAESPAAVAGNADVVLACLADVPASREVFLGPAGVVAAARSGQVFADHSTVDIATSRAVHEASRPRGAWFLDAPVSGGPTGAADATLTIMAGGEAEAFERARPVFAALGSTVIHVGGAGAGTAAKLANQLLVAVHSLAAAEALALAGRAGVDPGKLAAILARSWGQSRMLERAAPRYAAADHGPSGAPLRNLKKDLGIILDLARSLGLQLPAATEAQRACDTLVQSGRGEWDVTALRLLIEGAGKGTPDLPGSLRP